MGVGKGRESFGFGRGREGKGKVCRDRASKTNDRD